MHEDSHEAKMSESHHDAISSTSTARDYRFFNVAFACVLYNVWRLVDLLGKIALEAL